MRYVMSKVGILWLKGWWWGQIWKFDFVFNFFHRCLWINLENDELRRNIECFLMDRDRLRSRYINLYFYLYRFISMKINRAVKFFDFCINFWRRGNIFKRINPLERFFRCLIFNEFNVAEEAIDLNFVEFSEIEGSTTKDASTRPPPFREKGRKRAKSVSGKLRSLLSGFTVARAHVSRAQWGG